MSSVLPSSFQPTELKDFVPIVSGDQLLGVQPIGEALVEGQDPLTGATPPSPTVLSHFGERVYYTRGSVGGKVSGAIGSGSAEAGKVTVVQDSFLGKRIALPKGGSAIYVHPFGCESSRLTSMPTWP